MEQVEQRHDVSLQQGIDQIVVVIKAGLADLGGAVGENTGPGDGESEGLQAQFLHILDVFPVTVVEVRCEGGVAAAILFGVQGVVMVAYAFTLATLFCACFDLVSRRSAAKQKILGELKIHNNFLT